MSPVLDLLRDKFPEDDLLGEVLAPDDDARGPAATGEQAAGNTKQDEQGSPQGAQAPYLTPTRERLTLQSLLLLAGEKSAPPAN